MTKKTMLIIGIVTTIVFVVIAGAVFRPIGHRSDGDGGSTSNFRLLFVGSPEGFVGEAHDILKTRAECVEAEEAVNVQQLLQFSSTRTIDKTWIVMFDSTWLEQEANDTQLAPFIDDILQSGCKIISVGNSTSFLFYALSNAPSYGIQPGQRNPWSDDPTVAGFKLIKNTMPGGDVYFVPSILSGETEGAEEAARMILSWG